VKAKLNVLFITHCFPPSAEVGAKRLASFCRYLPEHDIKPIVLTVQSECYPLKDDTFPFPPSV
jgi:hypothetical protein